MYDCKCCCQTGHIRADVINLVDGSATTVTIGDIVAVRTDAHDRFTFDCDVPGVPWGVYIFEITKLQEEGDEGLKGYGKFFRSRCRSLDQPVTKSSTVDGEGLPLSGFTVAIIGSKQLNQLSSQQKMVIRKMIQM